VTRVGSRHLTVRTELEAADGSELPPLEVKVPIEHADLLDPSATPGALALVTAAAVRGEDLVVEGPVDEVIAGGLSEVGHLLSTWWGTGETRVTVTETTTGVARDDGGVGLFFTRGVDSWSTLLDLLELPPPVRVTHLLTVHHGAPILRRHQAEHIPGHQAVADELGLPLVVLETTARELLDPYRPWGETCGPALMATGLQVGAGLRRLVLTGAHPRDVHTLTGADPDLVTAIATTRTEVELGNPHRTRDQRVAHLRTSPLARASLQVCWEGLAAGNCGRCRKCQLTMASLLLAGDPDPSLGFRAPIDVDAVGAMSYGAELATFVAGMVDGLPAGEEGLRRALSDAWDHSRGLEARTRWGDSAPPPMAGPEVPARVAEARRATTGHPETPAAAPLGWSRRSVPLRPPATAHESVRARAATGPDRPRAWAVVEPHIRDEARDGRQADLAAALTAAHGPGVAYLPGILWDHAAPPVLDAARVGTLLRTARARLWWRADGDLDPLRVVEAIEHGCLPIQVMPAAVAQSLRSDLPAALAALVVAESDLAALDLGPTGVAALLAPAVDHVLLGSSEHDLRAPAPPDHH